MAPPPPLLGGKAGERRTRAALAAAALAAALAGCHRDNPWSEGLGPPATGATATGGTPASGGGGAAGSGGESTGGTPGGAAGSSGAGGADGGVEPGGGASTGGAGATGGAPDGGSSSGGAGGTGGDGGTSGQGGAGIDGGRAGSNHGGSAAGTSGAGSAGGGGQGGDGGAPVPPPVLTGLSVEPNPNNTLSAYVSWTTDVAADSAVEFGTTTYELRVRDAAAVTAHRVLVLGMHADSTYRLRAVSTTAGGSASAEGAFTTGSLPATVPLPEVTVGAGGGEGWTLVSVQPASPGGPYSTRPPGVAVMYDREGLPVWYFVNGDLPDELGDASVRLTREGHVLLGPTTLTPPQEIDLAGDVRWRGPEQPDGGGEGVPGIMTHDAGKLGNGDYVLLRNEVDANGFVGARVEEVTPDHEVVWSWSLFEHLQPDPARDDIDWCHPNAITIDEANELLYLGCRWLGVIKARIGGDQAIVWTLGEGLDGGSFTFDPPEAGFADEHDPEIHDDGTVLLYDNGGYTLFPTGSERSRVLELALDESAGTASLVWSFPGDFAVDAWYRDEWYTPFWGDADDLGDGHVLITAGVRSASASSRIFEVRRADGQVVWELTFPPDVGTYQAERVTPPVEAI